VSIRLPALFAAGKAGLSAACKGVSQGSCGGDVVEKREVKPTINDVADKAGVSKRRSAGSSTARLCSTMPREKVEAVIAELGYVPNPQARRWPCGAIS
jgi:hypothetical protein